MTDALKDSKAPPVPKPWMRDGVGLCHIDCPAFCNAGGIYNPWFRCLVRGRKDAQAGTPCPIWAHKAAKALLAMEILEKRKWRLLYTPGNVRQWHIESLSTIVAAAINPGKLTEGILVAEAALVKREAEAKEEVG